MPWYDGMTDEQIEAAIISGAAPGSTQPGGLLEVPDGFTQKLRLRLGFEERRRVATYLTEQALALRIPWLTDLVLGLARDIEAGKHHYR